MLKHLVRGAAIVTLLVLPLLASKRMNLPPSSPAPASVSDRPVFVHLFEWKWEDVARECETFLGPKGYGAVQVSPATEHVVVPEQGFPWWQRYQPVSYRIESRSGTREQFANMVARCHAAGVRIYADAVINHMAAADGTGIAGSTYQKYTYPGIYQPQDFHTCRSNIKNYGDRTEVTTCELVGLSDLNTSSEYVRQRIATYLIDLNSLGVDGFRIDAAKHMDTNDLKAILGIVNQSVEPDPYVYQEVIDPGYEAIRKNEYYSNGLVSEFEYGRMIGEKFMNLNGQSIAQLQTLGEAWGLAPSDEAIVFIDNHDKQRGHGGGGNYLTYKSGKLYDLANIFMLAHPYGTPQVMSSYVFTHPDQGPPADTKGNTRSAFVNDQSTCFEEWVCEHRRRPIANMVEFRNQIPATVPLTNWWSNGKNQIAFGRGSDGFVVINREEQPLTQTLQTGLPPGQYCNVIASDRENCATDAEVTVDEQGRMTVTIAPMSAVAIY